MTETLLAIFPTPNDMLALEPEELAGVLLEVIPAVLQSGRFHIQHLTGPLYSTAGGPYQHTVRPAELAIAEALSWLEHQGLVVVDPGQPVTWYVLTRRAGDLRTRADVEAYRKGRILPVELLQPSLADKVWPQFLRGDHDVAVFQAFKEIEVAVRKASNAKGAGYPDDLVGIPLMRKAFHPENGPLTDQSLVFAEREAEMHLFSGAIGHAKNPTSHRDVSLKPAEAARLVVFASHLLSILERRS
jgi:Protein of unknown function (Hypoth_ymh)